MVSLERNRLILLQLSIYSSLKNVNFLVSLMIACGRTDSDRRQELVKLFGLLRSDGIFPSAVTLGQVSVFRSGY